MFGVTVLAEGSPEVVLFELGRVGNLKEVNCGPLLLQSEGCVSLVFLKLYEKCLCSYIVVCCMWKGLYFRIAHELSK